MKSMKKINFLKSMKKLIYHRFSYNLKNIKIFIQIVIICYLKINHFIDNGKSN